MKIISNYKDYYDYLQGIYGIDEKITYERICEIPSINGNYVKSGMDVPDFTTGDYNKLKVFTLAVCGTIYPIFSVDNKVYHGSEILDIIADDTKTKMLKGQYYSFGNSGLGLSNSDEHTLMDTIRSCVVKTVKTDINDKEKCPVLLVKGGKKYELDVLVKNPRLSDYKFHKFHTAEEMFIMIGDFFSKEVKIEDKRTNVEKIVSHGFDKVSSFRNIK